MLVLVLVLVPVLLLPGSAVPEVSRVLSLVLVILGLVDDTVTVSVEPTALGDLAKLAVCVGSGGVVSGCWVVSSTQFVGSTGQSSG